MPIYEFECDKCKKQFEVVTLSLSEKPKAVCPKCKSKKSPQAGFQGRKGKVWVIALRRLARHRRSVLFRMFVLFLHKLLVLRSLKPRFSVIDEFL